MKEENKAEIQKLRSEMAIQQEELKYEKLRKVERNHRSQHKIGGNSVKKIY